VVRNVPHLLTAVVATCSVVLTLNSVWTELLKVLGELVAELAVLSLEVTVVHLHLHHMLSHKKPVFHVLIATVIVHTGLPAENVLKTLVICLLIAKRVVTNAQVALQQEVTVTAVVAVLVLTAVKSVPHHLTAVVVICSVVLTLNSVWIEPPKVLGVPVAVHAVLKEVTPTQELINLVPVNKLAQEDSTVVKSAHHPLIVVVQVCSVVLNGKYVWIRPLRVPMVTVVVLVTLLRMFKLHPWSNLVLLIWLLPS